METEEEENNYLGNTQTFDLTTLIRAQAHIKETEDVLLMLREVEDRLRG
jgi:hypothetical protein